MQGYLKRHIHGEIVSNLNNFPVVALLGPRQCGKTTLARRISRESGNNTLYLDLERDSDLRKLDNPEFFFGQHREKLICLDEIQLKPELFRILRPEVDDDRRNGRFLILGSASRDLVQSSSQSLAGRVGFVELAPFSMNEVSLKGPDDPASLTTLWNRGGFPDSFLSRGDKSSLRWRRNFVRTFLERDISKLGFRIPSENMKRLWTMLAHSHGQILNASKLGESLGVSHTTVRTYIEIMAETFMVRVLRPYFANTKKRLVKSPKIYVRDSGVLHALLQIENTDALFGHPVFGASWEGFAMENILAHTTDWEPFFYRTSSGNEIDLVLAKGLRKIGVEFKASKAPKVGKGVLAAVDELEIERLLVVAPVDQSYDLNETTTICTLLDAIERCSRDDDSSR